MNSTAVDIADILVDDSSLGLTIGSNLFVGREPITPDDTVTLIDTPGMPPMLTMDVHDYYYPSFQVRVRNVDYRTGWTMINDIKESLHGRAHETWNGTLYMLISCANEPFLLMWDDNNRCVFLCNFNVQRRR